MDRNLRPSGIPALGEIPWGSHICQFYRSTPELLDLVVPWFKAGLENNEYCIWMTSRGVTCAQAEAALRAACRDFDTRLACGQILIASGEQWYRAEGRFDGKRVFGNWIAALPQALAKGFEGLRVSSDASWLESHEWRDFVAFEAFSDANISTSKVLALCTYAAEACGTGETLDAMQNHAFALIRRDGAWEVIENQARRRALATAREFQRKYEALIGNISSGFAYNQLICDERGEPVDCFFVDANEAFERMTGLRREAILGRRMSEVFPAAAAGEIFRRYARVAMTGEPAKYEEFAPPLGKWFSVAAYSPERGYVAVTLEEISERTGPASAA